MLGEGNSWGPSVSLIGNLSQGKRFHTLLTTCQITLQGKLVQRAEQ